jgi:RsiW-degrading membrane proteinase PrsW (M82 family)
VQSKSGWSLRGAGTSTIIFTRILGQALGAALFGGIVNAYLGSAAGGGDLANRLLDPKLRRALPPSQLQMLTDSFAQAIHVIFLAVVVFALLVLLVGLFLPAGSGLRHEVDARADD